MKTTHIPFMIVMMLCLCQAQAQDEGSRAVSALTSENESLAPANTYAIIMGISSYPNLHPLKYAHLDAWLFREFLLSEAGGSVPEPHIQLFLEEKATSSNFWLQGMRWLVDQKPVAGDRVYIYLAGHGDAINSSEYFFLTYDCEPGNDKNNYLLTGNIQLYNLKSRIRQMTGSGVEVILIMDACRTGDIPGGQEGISFFSQSIIEMQAGELMLLSAGANQFAYEDQSFGGGHGLFTYYLIRGLGGDADEDADGAVTFDEIQEYARINVRKLSREKYALAQVPQFCCSDDGMTTMGIVDDQFREYMAELNLMTDIYGKETLIASSMREAKPVEDPVLSGLYIRLSAAIDDQAFFGEKNARDILDSMISLCPECEIVTEAKRNLAAAYLNFGQARINLYLSGKENEISVAARKKSPDGKASAGKRTRIQTLAATKYGDAAELMKEGLALLGGDENLANIYRTKISFLELYSKRKSISSMDPELLARTIEDLVRQDSGAYIFNLAGLIFSDLGEEEKAIDYYLKAIEKAPNWTYPYNNIGKYYLDADNNAQAVSWYSKTLALDSNYVEAMNGLGAAYSNMGDYELGEKWLLKALLTDDRHTLANNNLGSLYYDMKLFEKARYYCLQAVAIDTAYADAYDWLGLISEEMDDDSAAEAYYLRALHFDSLMSYSYTHLGWLCYHQGRTEEADEYFQKAISADDKDPYAYNALGYFLELDQDYDSATVLYMKAISLDSTFSDPYVNMGDVSRSLGDYEKAIEWYLKSIDLDSSVRSAYLGIGMAYFKLDQYDEAEEWSLKCISVDSTYDEPYGFLGRIKLWTDNYKESEYWLQKAFSLDSSDRITCEDFSLLYFSLENYPESEKWALKAIGLDSSSTYAYQLVSYSCAYDDRPADAEKWLLIGLSIDGTDKYSLLVSLRWLYDRNREYDKKISALKESMTLDPDREPGNMLNSIGWTFYLVNQLDSAEAYYLKSIERDGSLTYPHGNLALTHLIRGNSAAALEYLEEFVELQSEKETGAYDHLLFFLTYTQLDDPDRASSSLKKAEKALAHPEKTAYDSISGAFIRFFRENDIEMLSEFFMSTKFDYETIMDFAPFFRHPEVLQINKLQAWLKEQYPYGFF